MTRSAPKAKPTQVTPASSTSERRLCRRDTGGDLTGPRCSNQASVAEKDRRTEPLCRDGPTQRIGGMDPPAKRRLHGRATTGSGRRATPRIR